MNRYLRKDINYGFFFASFSFIIIIMIIFIGIVIYNNPYTLLSFLGFIFLIGMGTLISRARRKGKRKRR